MNQFILLIAGLVALSVGAILGYYARQSIAQKQAGTLEAKLQKKVLKAKQESESMLAQAEQKSQEILESAQKEINERRSEVLKTERFLLRRESSLAQKVSNFDKKQKEFEDKIEQFKEAKKKLEEMKGEALVKLEKIAEFSKDEAKQQLFSNIEKEEGHEIFERLKKLEKEGWEKYEEKAKELLVTAIQKCALSQAQETTTTSLSLPSEEIKGRIIGKEGRNIRALEKLTGVEVIVDETPETVIISGFDPVRRQIAKIALEKLIQDGRIQPVKVEEQVQKAEAEILKQIKSAGETAVYDTGYRS